MAFAPSGSVHPRFRTPPASGRDSAARWPSRVWRSAVLTALVAACGSQGTSEGGAAGTGGASAGGASGGAAAAASGGAGDGGAAGGGAGSGGGEALDWALRFDRLEASSDFRVFVEGPLAVASTASPDIQIDRGQLGPVERTDNGWVAQASPESTGRHIVAVTLAGDTITKVALVLAELDEELGQPEPVAGLVNTAGWEDGVSVSPDGQWLFLQYLPVPIDCILGGDPDTEVCTQAVGPIGAPERPAMPGADRVAADGSIQVTDCPSLGVEGLPVPAPPNTLYGFSRQADGSFADPFVISFTNNDGCFSVFGPELVRGSDASAPILTYALDDPFDSDADTRGDLFHAPVELGQYVELGTAGPGQLTERIDAPLAADVPEHRGNPFVRRLAPDSYVLFFDDEVERHDLFVSEATNLQGPWSAASALPPTINLDASESQPSFDGSTLYFRRELTLYAVDYLGGAFHQEAAWGTPRVLLAGDPAASAGEILGVGEPSVANHAGQRELYFVFVEVAENGTANLDIGRVPFRS